MRAEFDEVLKAGLSRRLGRLERKVNRLIEGSSGNNGQENISPKAATNGSSPTAAASLSVTEEAVQTTSSGSQDYWQEERKFGDHVPVEKLADAFEKAYLHAIRSTWPVQKKWGPSRRQNNYEDPPYKEEKLEKEMTTMRSTFSSLAQNLANRERQIISLKAQRDVAKAAVRDEEDKVSELEETLRQVSDPKKLPAVYESKRTLQKQDLEKLTVELQRTKAEAKQMQTLAKQQHAFFVQAETIFCQERGAERMRRFPAGEVFIVPQPLPMDDEKAESWDVGTAVANPYEVDSWPFEPNVLARRCPKECPMDNVTEETFEDLMEAQRPGRTNPFRGGLNLHSMNNDDDDYDGPSATSRSL